MIMQLLIKFYFQFYFKRFRVNGKVVKIRVTIIDAMSFVGRRTENEGKEPSKVDIFVKLIVRNIYYLKKM